MIRKFITEYLMCELKCERDVGNTLCDPYYIDKGLILNTTFFVHTMQPLEGLPAGVRFGEFTLCPMPGCCGVVVSTATKIAHPFVGKKLSKHMHKLKEHVALELGYSLMLSTTVSSNAPQVAGATKANWLVLEEFKNSRTGNELLLMSKRLENGKGTSGE